MASATTARRIHLVHRFQGLIPAWLYPYYVSRAQRGAGIQPKQAGLHFHDGVRTADGRPIRGGHVTVAAPATVPPGICEINLPRRRIEDKCVADLASGPVQSHLFDDEVANCQQQQRDVDSYILLKIKRRVA